MEGLRSIPGYEGLYLIDTSGNVLSCRKNRYLKPKRDKDGYKEVVLYRNGSRKYYRVHRLVVITYIPNPNGYPVVNHKNEVKDDNEVSNLEWCTVKYNDNYGSRNHKMSQTKQTAPVLQLDLSGNVIGEFRGVKEAMRITGVNRNCIREVIRGNRKSAGGYVWRYKEVRNERI